MKIIEPDYQLERMGDADWRFLQSSELEAATQKFDAILESGGGKRGLTVALRAFLNDCPNHIDALHHYAMCKMDDGKPLDAFAFAHTAVAVGRAVFPPGFRLEKDCLPGGWIENRPFLRALHGLMIAQRATYQTAAAIETARELIGCESGDRMGARFVLPLYLLEQNRDREALEVFSFPGFEDTFGPTEYLHALALIRLERLSEVAKVLQPCFRYLPKVAHHLLDPQLPKPRNESPFGVAMGSDYEAWNAAIDQRWVWERTKGALPILASEWEVYSKSRPKEAGHG
jgi:hypothetical protein